MQLLLLGDKLGRSQNCALNEQTMSTKAVSKYFGMTITNLGHAVA
jgi:hypothetical protein